MPDGPLRMLGEHQVELHLHTDVNVSITVLIESSDQAE
jgi:ribosomal protein L9